MKRAFIVLFFFGLILLPLSFLSATSLQQSTPVVGYIFMSGRCSDYMDEGVVFDPDAIAYEMHNGEWIEMPFSDENAGDSNLGHEYNLIICPAGAGTYELDVDAYASASGGYRVSTEVGVRQIGSTTYLLFDGSTYSEGGGCVSNSAHISDTLSATFADEEGWFHMNEIYISHSFCAAPCCLEGYSNFRLFDMSIPTPTPTPTETPTPTPTATPSTCPIGYMPSEGACVPLSALPTPVPPPTTTLDLCDGVTCSMGRECYQGQCVPVRLNCETCNEVMALRPLANCDPLDITVTHDPIASAAVGGVEEHNSTYQVTTDGYYIANLHVLARARGCYPIDPVRGEVAYWTDYLQVDNRFAEESSFVAWVWNKVDFGDYCSQPEFYGNRIGNCIKNAPPTHYEIYSDDYTLDLSTRLSAKTETPSRLVGACIDIDAGGLGMYEYDATMDGELKAIFLPQGCSPPDGAPPPAPECYGTEMIFDTVTVDAYDTYEIMSPYQFEDYNVRVVFLIPPGEERSMLVAVDEYDEEYYVIGSDFFAQYDAMVPYQAIEGPNAPIISIGNLGEFPLDVQSICVQDLATRGCENPDPDMDTSAWGVSDGGQASSAYPGSYLLFPGASVYQVAGLLEGVYYIHVDAKTNHNSLLRVYAGGEPVGSISLTGDNLWRRYVLPASIVSSGNQVITLMSDEGNPENKIWVTRVCLEQIADFPIAPTPTPTTPPSDIPNTPDCINPDPGFNVPGAWEIINYAQIDTDETGNAVLSLLHNGAQVRMEEGFSLSAGTYYLNLNARAVNEGDGYFKRIFVQFFRSDGNYQRNYEFVLGLDGRWATYPTTIQLDQDVDRFAIYGERFMPGRLSIPDINDVFAQVAYVCISNTPPPTPTAEPTMPPPGDPTPTHTPIVPAPEGCANPDPGIDQPASFWSTLGSGYIQDSIAVLPPEAQLVAEFEPDNSTNYALHMVARCSYPVSADLYWRSDHQTFTCVSPEFIETTFLFNRISSSRAVADPFTGLLEEQDAWNPPTFISPLTAPDMQRAIAEGETHDWNLQLVEDMFSLAARPSNLANLEIQSICIKDTGWTPDPEPEPEDVTLYHPVCERDWVIQREWSDTLFGYFHAMLVGPGQKPGMPVHAPYGGFVTDYGPDVSFTFGHDVAYTTYDHCVRIDHTALFGIPVYSVVCNLESFTIPSSLEVTRGSLLGYTSDYEGNNGLRGEGLAVVALQVNGDWVDPEAHYEGFVDCRPYKVTVEEMEHCAADDGSGTIPPRFNPPAPSFWEPNEWVPWLAKRIYDTVGYPILCVLVGFFNLIIRVINNVINALLRTLAPILMFIYRIGRLFEHVLDVFITLFQQLCDVVMAWRDVALCLRSVVGFFLAAFQDATEADISINAPRNAFGVWVLKMVIFVINQTVLAWMLAAAVGLIIGAAAWRLVPWGIRKLRQAIGMGEG